MFYLARCFKYILFTTCLILPLNIKADVSDIKEVLELIQKDLRTLERD